VLRTWFPLQALCILYTDSRGWNNAVNYLLVLEILEGEHFLQISLLCGGAIDENIIHIVDNSGKIYATILRHALKVAISHRVLKGQNKDHQTYLLDGIIVLPEIVYRFYRATCSMVCPESPRRYLCKKSKHWSAKILCRGRIHAPIHDFVYHVYSVHYELFA
jgi:hypothetical protein